MRIGDWTVIPSQNVIERDGACVKLEPRAMDLLVYLAGAGRRVVSPDELLRDVWHGRVFDDGVVYKKINQLRRALGDDSHHPRFIETIPKRGYRLVAPVVLDEAPAPEGHSAAVPGPTSSGPTTAAAAGFGLTLRRWRLGVGSSPNPRPRRWRLGALALAIAAAAVTGLAIVDERWQVPDERLLFTPLPFQRDGSEVLHTVGSTVWSADGRAIAFAAQKGSAPGAPQIYVLYLDSPMARLLSNSSEGGLPKAWTASGRIVVNTSRGPFATSESAGLFTMPAVGGRQEPFFSLPAGATNIMDVSRDGGTLAVVRRAEDGPWGIWTSALPDGTLQRYEPAPFAATGFSNLPALSFSPDGRQLLLMWNPTGRGEQAWLMPYPPDPERPPRRVLESLPQVYTPTFSWLPDNRHIVVSTAAPDRPLRLYLADTVSGRFRLFADGSSTALQAAPLVSPDGKRLLFTELNVNLDIVTFDVGTMVVTPLVTTNGIEQMPAWGTGTDSFVYVVERDGVAEIWLRTAEGEARPLVSTRDFEPGTTRFFLAPQLSPDGTRVAYSRVESDRRGAATVAKVWISSVDGGAPMRLTDSPLFEVAGSWSPDGNWYVYSEVSDGNRVLKKAATSGHSKPITLVPALPSRLLPIWSPDGGSILYDGGGLKLISVDGELVRDFGLKDTLCAFARSEPSLYCIRDLFGAPMWLVVALADGSTRDLAPVARTDAPTANGGPSLRLSVTPDGRGVTYAVDRTQVRLVLVDGLDTVARP